MLSLYKADLTCENDRSSSKLCVCVRAIQGRQPGRGRQVVEDLMGVSGVVLALPPGMEDSPNTVSVCQMVGKGDLDFEVRGQGHSLLLYSTFIQQIL